MLLRVGVGELYFDIYNVLCIFVGYLEGYFEVFVNIYCNFVV